VFARWLLAALRKHGAATLVPIHVIEDGQLAALADDDIDIDIDIDIDMQSLAQEALAQALERTGDPTPLPELRLVEEGAPEQVLAEAAEGGAGLIIGRLAPRGQDQVFRLGSVARRLARRLPAPVIIVPPDLNTMDLGEGPVIFACSAEPNAEGALSFAMDMADKLGRELLLAHVVHEHYGWAEAYLPADTTRRLHAKLNDQGRERLDHWATEHGVAGRQGVVIEGRVTDQLRRLARRHDALMIVCGSRKFDALRRLFVTSVGVELSASARCPVALVPSDYRAS